MADTYTLRNVTLEYVIRKSGYKILADRAYAIVKTPIEELGVVYNVTVAFQSNK